MEINRYVIVLVAALLLYDFFGSDLVRSISGDETEVNAAHSKSETDVTRDLLQKSLGGRVYIAYCTSWSYRGAFLQIKDSLQQNFPELEVNGGNYPTAASKAFASQVLRVVQFSVIGMAVAGDYVFTNMFNYPPNGPFPPLYENIREKKIIVGMGAWLVGNAISQGLTSTGAFEIYYNGQVASSKLAPTSSASSSHSGNGGVPSMQFIVNQMLRIDPALAHRRLNTHARASSYTRKTDSKDDSDDVNTNIHDLSYDEQ